MDPPPSWRREAVAIREQGLAFDREEMLAGVCCVAVPLWGTGTTPVASLCIITDPTHRLERLGELATRIGRAVDVRLRART